MNYESPITGDHLTYNLVVGSIIDPMLRSVQSRVHDKVHAHVLDAHSLIHNEFTNTNIERVISDAVTPD